MKKLIHLCFLLCFISSVSAQESDGQKGHKQPQVLQTYDWNDVLQQHPIPDSEIISMDGMSVLKIQNQSTNRLIMPQISLVTITNPAIIKKAEFISVELKCIDLGRNTPYAGFLKLYQTIPPYAPGGDEQTIGTPGHLGFLGTMNWTREDLNVERSQIEGLPTQLELKLYVPANGTVYLRPIKLWGVPRDWWSPRQSALMGGIGGSLIGCFGALIGILTGRGKARRFVLTTTAVLIVAGILLVIAGLIAVAMKQPYGVWYPLLLSGAILTFVLSINVYSIKRRYDDLEIRRMTSMDATGR